MKQKRKYKNSKKMDKQTKKIIILIAVVIALMIFTNLLINKSVNKPEVDNESTFSSIKQIIENFGCTYIKEEKSKDKNYYLDIYLDFKFNPFEKNESKQRSYENVMGNLYQYILADFRLIDEEKNLTIEVIGNTSSNRFSYYYLINGQENYFENEKSKLSLNNYEEDKKTKLEINSEIIRGLIENNWNANINFGSKESTFENYDIYFDEGIEVRKISGKVFNVIFTNKYQNEIVNGIKVGETFTNIIRKLGVPTYGKEDSSIIGYQADDIYIFFSNSEVSIYRNEKYETKEFEKLLSKYIEKEINVKEFMNELTYLWDDYSKYSYDTNYINIRYPLKGLEINMTTDNSKGIMIFNNYSKTEKTNQFIKDGKITSKLQDNLVYLEEQDRQAIKEGYIYQCNMEKQKREIENKQVGQDSKKYSYYLTENQISFVSIDEQDPNQTITEQVNTGFWYNDYIFIYSVINKGIYSYNLETKAKNAILEGKEEFTFNNYDNNVLTYDGEKQIQILN